MKEDPQAIRLPDGPRARAGAGALAAMSRGVLAVLECPDMRTAAAHVLASCRELIGARCGRVAMIAPDGTWSWYARLEPGGRALRVPAAGSRPVAGLARLADRIGAGTLENGRAAGRRDLPLPRACAAWTEVLALPLTIGGRAEGLLLLGDRPRGFTARDLLVASTFAALAGAAHQRCTAAEELARQVRDVGSDLARTNRDLLRQVRSTEEMRGTLAREHAFRIAIENSVPTGIAASDPQGRILHVNRAFCRMVGWPGRQLVGTAPPYRFWPPARRAEYLEGFRRQSPRSAPPGGYHVRFRRRDGTDFEVRVMTAPLRGPDGKPAGWVASFRDVTAELRTQAELGRAAGQLRVISARLIEAEERERKRIARELHDSLGQTLTALKLGLEGALAECRRTPCGSATPRSLQRALRILSGAAAEVRNVVADLRPTILDDLGLASAISWFCREFNRVHPRVRCSAAIRPRDGEVPEHLKTTVFRLVQEGLTNVVKHSGADRARVRLGTRRGRIELTIEDNGRGFRSGRPSGGAGLVGMRERTELAGGEFAVISAPGRGTTLRASWPLPPAAKP